MPASKNQIKLVSSLAMKKFRDETGLFIAEGTKLVADLAKVFSCESVFATQEWLNNHFCPNCDTFTLVTEADLSKLSQQKSPQGILALFRKPEFSFDAKKISDDLILVLDGVQDPGNLGTIIRIADWFGITQIICSPESADSFAPKVVQATMGALASVKVNYMALPHFFQQLSKEIPVYGTFMEGSNIYAESLDTKGVIILGNEGKGISREVEKFVTKKLMIPEFSEGKKNSESLNVAVSAAIVCSEFRRRTV